MVAEAVGTAAAAGHRSSGIIESAERVPRLGTPMTTPVLEVWVELELKPASLEGSLCQCPAGVANLGYSVWGAENWGFLVY